MDFDLFSYKRTNSNQDQQSTYGLLTFLKKSSICLYHNKVLEALSAYHFDLQRALRDMFSESRHIPATSHNRACIYIESF